MNVRNLDWAPGSSDGDWIDIGGRVRELPDGRKYKSAMNVLTLGCSYDTGHRSVAQGKQPRR